MANYDKRSYAMKKRFLLPLLIFLLALPIAVQEYSRGTGLSSHPAGEDKFGAAG
jgi:hypothetical protein